MPCWLGIYTEGLVKRCIAGSNADLKHIDHTAGLKDIALGFADHGDHAAVHTDSGLVIVEQIRGITADGKC